VKEKKVSDTLLATKIHVPPLRSNLVNRSRLIQQLNDGITQNHRLTLISAPAGYGKSTLLSEWASQLTIPLAWLSLEKTENSPARFWSYFIAALSTITSIRKLKSWGILLRATQAELSPPMELLLENIVNDFSVLEGPVILVLDDFHFIDDHQVHQDLIYLIDHLPLSANGLHVIISSRMDPPWPLARWRARNELNELRPFDLRFSQIETIRFLNQILHLELSEQEINAIQARTEGWVAGLQLAAISIQGRIKIDGLVGASRFLEAFTGSNRFILDYLMEEVIGQQTAEVRDFLFCTSILTHLSAPLCDALLGRNDSLSIIKQLEQANLFLIPLDDERQWYRYHHLFAELLNNKLKQKQPDKIDELYRRASHWFAESNFLPEAVIHAIQAGDYHYASDLISVNALGVLEHSELLELLRYFDEIPEKDIFQSPWLSVAYSWLKAYTEPTQGLEPILQRIENCLSNEINDSDRHRLIGHLAGIRAYVAWVKGRSEETLEFTSEALEHLPESDLSTRCHILHTQGSALQYLDRLPEAIQSFEAAIIVGQRAGQIQETLLSNHSLAYIYYLQGKLHHAFSVCKQVLSMAKKYEKGIKRDPILAQVYSTISLIQLEWNEVESAINNARKAVNLAEQWKQADALHYTMNTLSLVLCAAGKLDEAFTVNHLAMQLAENVSSWYLLLSICNEIQINLAKGDITAAAQWFKQIEPRWDERTSDTLRLTKALLQYEQGLISDLLTTLEEGIEDVVKKGEIWFLMRLLLLQALALYVLGHHDEALLSINRCLGIAEPEGYVRIFIERGTPMLSLLQLSARQGIHPEYINQLLPTFGITKTSQEPTPHKIQSTEQSPLINEPLSERELQVLRLLESPLTSTEIGRELYLSQNTIRTHMRNIYSKLAVHGRIEAIQKAREIGLLK
jgi:LuxR family maltose regulon positive regulatory protein